jgi:hypothetical protein
MPKDLRERMSQEELHYRLRHVRDLEADAAAMGTPALSRRLTAKARKVTNAMPWYQYCDEKKRLEAGRDNATSAGMLDLQAGYNDALRKLDANHPQAPDIGHFLDSTVGKPHEPVESLDDIKGAGTMLHKRSAVDRLVKAELKKYEAKHAAEVERIRREIAELESAAKAGGATPLERARATTKAADLEAEADRLERLADTVTERELSKLYRQQACEKREEALRVSRRTK